MTVVYFIRHAESENSVRDGRVRPLTEKGRADCRLVTDFFQDKKIDCVLSSPFKHAVDTVADFAKWQGIDIEVIEDFRERKSDSDWVRETDFYPFMERQWADFSYSQSDGECLAVVQERNIAALEDVLGRHQGKNIVIGTHGTALSTIINFYDHSYGFADFMAMVDIMPWVVKMVFDGNRFVGMEKIDLFAHRMIESVLSCYGINTPAAITQIYRSAWDINDTYILKINPNKSEFDKSIIVNRLLLSEEVPALDFISTPDDEPYVFYDDKYWYLMKKINGSVFDPFVGDPEQNGVVLGKAVARLHIAFKNIEKQIDVRDADFHDELISWIMPELDKEKTVFTDGVMDSLNTFFREDYKSLPRQLIHRDMHTSNLLFENDILSGYLDFDMIQRNVRIFDLVYLGCSQLVENYQDDARLKVWREIFFGIINGYSESLPLSEDERMAIPALFLFDEVLFTAFYLKIGQTKTAQSSKDMTNWIFKNLRSLLNGDT